MINIENSVEDAVKGSHHYVFVFHLRTYKIQNTYMGPLSKFYQVLNHEKTISYRGLLNFKQFCLNCL